MVVLTFNLNIVSFHRLLGTPQPRTLYFLVEAKSRVREVYTQTCLHFAKQGMLDTELFGLAVLIGKKNRFECFVHFFFRLLFLTFCCNEIHSSTATMYFSCNGKQ